MGLERSRLRRGAVLAVVLLAALGFGVWRTLPHLFPQLMPGGVWGGARGAPSAPDAPAALADLPVVYYDGHDAHGPVAILLSGNGGWWGLCDRLAARLAKEHVTTLGLNSLAYFVRSRSPKEVAADIARMVATVDEARPVLLLGYSYGADIVATVYQDLDPAVRSRVQVVSLLALTHDVTYGIGFWHVAAERRKTTPAVRAIVGPLVQCIVGKDDGRRSGCRGLDRQQTEIVAVPGGHHFGGDYDALARLVLDGWRRRTGATPPDSGALFNGGHPD